MGNVPICEGRCGREAGLESESEEDADSDLLRAPVVLRVYDVSLKSQVARANQFLYRVGTGAYHSAVEVYGIEWSYGRSRRCGIFSSKPGECAAHHYRQQVFMGYTALCEEEVKSVLKSLRPAWHGQAYHLLRHNCTHFCDAFCERLGVGQIPRWVRSLALATVNFGDGVQHAKEVVKLPMAKVTKLARKSRSVDANDLESSDDEFTHAAALV
eukprot:TRINITY_DN2551_c0_g2_i1.p1 TRINITY_DN2551_c0_g2~~TRINITY_DN2551_c0_g2_i1.p1  ORF type:complete len:213 (-),score=31.04 TRINITY_DN2551_c0_g2_i1:90-728(-)